MSCGLAAWDRRSGSSFELVYAMPSRLVIYYYLQISKSNNILSTLESNTEYTGQGQVHGVIEPVNESIRGFNSMVCLNGRTRPSYLSVIIKEGLYRLFKTSHFPPS